MTNDRLQGVFSFNIEHPYEVSVNGAFEKRTGIICHEMNNKGSCNVAADLETLVKSGIMAVQSRSSAKQTQKQIQKEEKVEEDFYKKNAPAEAEVKKRADELNGLFGLQDHILPSRLMEVFEGIVAEKLISTDGDKVMYGNVWDSIHYKSKLDIIFRYIVFFANPLQSLSQLSTAGDETNTTASETKK